MQAIVLPISDRHLDYAASVRDRLKAAGLRADLDERQEKIGYKIREAQLQKSAVHAGRRRPGGGRRHGVGADSKGRRPGVAGAASCLSTGRCVEIRERVVDAGQDAAGLI